MGKFMIKLIMNGVVVVGMLMMFTEATFLQAAVTAFVLAGIAYLLGDQAVLRATNNGIAVIADAVLAFVYLWSVASLMNWSLSWGELFMITLALGVVEAVFHMYLQRMDKAPAD